MFLFKQSTINTMFCSFFFLFTFCIAFTSGKHNKLPDEDKTLAELVELHGFRLEEYEITTEDGYVLTLQRVVWQNFTTNPNATTNEYNKHRKPVLIWHGLCSHSDHFFINTFDLATHNESKFGDNIGYSLLNTNRYDVWMGNSRGNKYSQKHVHLTTSDAEFWNFTIDHLSKFDLPPVIQFIREKTGHRSIAYIGHSQGVGTLLALMSEKPHFADIIKPFVAWAPGVFVGHTQTILFQILSLLLGLGKKEDLSPQQLDLVTIIKPFINLDNLPLDDENLAKQWVENVWEKYLGKTYGMDLTRIPTWEQHALSSISIYQLEQYIQLHQTKRFAKYDYGEKKNLLHYNTPTNPDYSLNNVPAHTKIWIAYGESDLFISSLDVQRLIDILKPNLKGNVEGYKVADNFNHVDFLFAKGLGKVLIDPTIDYLDKNYF